MAKARVRVPERLEYFVRSDWKKVIYQASLGVEDTRIAEMYLLDAMPQADIGAELDIDRSKHLRRIIDKVERAVEKLNLF